jgi:hypothetical protein
MNRPCRSAMRRCRGLLLAAALASCTQAGTSVVPIDVQLEVAGLPSATLRIRSTFAAGVAEQRFTCAGVDCYPVVRLGLRLPADAQNTVSLTVERLDAADHVVANGTASVDVVPGHVGAVVTIPLVAVGPPVNQGDAAAADGATGDGGTSADTTPADAARSDAAPADSRPDVTTDATDGGGGIDRPADMATTEGGGVDRPADLPTAGSDATDSAPDAVAPDATARDACVARSEDCFNGVDDDCDGFADCADSDCQPDATCVPTVSGRTLGALVSTAICPARFTRPQPITTGFHDVRTCDGCNCTAGTTCTIAIVRLGLNCTTMSSPPVTTITLADACDRAVTIQTGSTINAIPHCAPSTTTGQVSAPRWDQSGSFCEGVLGGGGCATGSVCLPRAAGTTSTSCYLAAGTDPSACAAPYSSRGVWYSGFTGSPACTCGCGAPVGGNCAGAMLITTPEPCPTTGALQGTVTLPSSGVCQYPSVSFQLEGTPTPPTCGATTSVTGDARVPTGAQVLCCL